MPPQWHIPLSQSDLNFASEYIPKEKKTLVISPAASKDERNWLTSRYAQLADAAVEQGYDVILCGSPAEREIKLGQEITQLMKYNAVNLIGKTTLKQLTALLRYAQVVVAPDSGPAHLATTQGTPVIGLYGHSNPKRTGPCLSLDRVVSVYEQHVQEQYKKPLNELPWSTRVKGEHIMEDIQLEQVLNQLRRIN